MDELIFGQFSKSYENELDDTFKKNNGIFYTDLELAETILRFLDIPVDANIIDPCCGTGSFLYLLDCYGYKNIYGCDFHEETIKKCKEITGLKNVFCLDTLGQSGQAVLRGLHKKKFDYVIGNPPYAPIGMGSKINADQRFMDLVRQSGNNLFVAAIYRSFELCKSDGVISFIVPKNLLHISSYEKLRKELLRKKNLLSVIELGIHFKAVRGEQVVLTFQNNYDPGNKVKFYKYINGSIQFMSESKQAYYTNEIIVFTDNSEVPIYNKLKESYNVLGEVCAETIHRGRDKSEEAITGKQIRKFGFKNRQLPAKGTQIFIQNIFSAEAGITASFAGNLKSAETVTILKMNSMEMCKYMLGLLHSRVCNYYLIRFGFNNSRLTIHTDAKYLNAIPVVIDSTEMDAVISIVNQMEQTPYMEQAWFDLNEELNKIVYQIYHLDKDDQSHIEKEMRKISASKWYGDNCVAM